MQIWQRGTSFTAPSGYTADRWYVAGTGTQPNVSQVASPIRGYQYALQITGVAGNTQTYAYQKIESYNCTDLAAQNITVQMVLQASTAQTVTIVLAYANSQDNWGAETIISSLNFSVTTSAQVFTTTFTNLPSGAANGLQLIIYPQGGGAFTSGTLKITGVQLEIGTSATPFERRLYNQELANCQRYLPAWNMTAANQVYGQGQVTSTAAGAIYLPFKVSARTAPTGVTASAAANFYLTTAGYSVAGTYVSTAFGYGSTEGITILCNCGSGLTQGYVTTLASNSTSSQILATGCEL
jgi:hypothetical protein